MPNLSFSLYGAHVLAFAFCAYLVMYYQLSVPLQRPKAEYTIRVNTFRRNDLLKQFLDHYTTCEDVKEITVVWSDTMNKPPADLAPELYSSRRIVYEIHRNNSLSNRFLPLRDVPTDAVFSVDEDVLLSCGSLRRAFAAWTSNRDTLIGFSPRLHAHDPDSGAEKYLKWQHTWWNGEYSIILTKACFLHKKYLTAYFEVIPPSFLADIDKNRNCEDLAMAHVVAMKSGKPPVWVKGVVHELAIDEGGISSRQGHFTDRSKCLGMISRATGNSWPWQTTHQKAIPLTFSDILTLITDGK